MVKIKGKHGCKKPAKIKAHGELPLAFYLCQPEQIDCCRPELVEGYGWNTDFSLAKK